ncbi:helix-turn-helix domain-containing protein [Flavobacterium sp. SH_e]|uniref:helix-turn-helix domain-containing protein n=1 Tax=unclassified Flavobacterium TaxID=196869 RepID=UPI0021E424E0|nr:helix-turn-helix transcriptional regulator [Flavobacterium sp. SH_e]MCV2486961.1 helix-turn-helix domain-containing protein [Flavobacterium sp. SH_e]
MNIGNAIKLLRKEKKMGQRDLAEKCDISINALSQIEINASFPQKSTIEKICKALDIPVSYLLFFSITDEDIPLEKQEIFNMLSKTIKTVLVEKVK